MSKCDAAPPVMLAEFAVGHFAGSEHGSVGGEGIEFACEGHQQVDGDTGREENGQQYGQVSGEVDEEIQDEEHAARHHHGLSKELEGQQVALPHITPFGLTKQEGGVNHHSQREWEDDPRSDGANACNKICREDVPERACFEQPPQPSHSRERDHDVRATRHP